MDKRAEKRVARVLVRALRTPATRGTQPSQITPKSAFLMIAFFFVAGFGLLNITAAPATAAPVSSASEPSSPGLSFDDSSKSDASKDDVVITATVVGSALAEAIAKSISKATGSSYAFAVAQGQSKAKIDRSNCMTSPGINTYWSGGVLVRDYDPVPSRVCKLKAPQTVGGFTYYWKKIGGGTSGSACNNLFVPTHQNVSYAQVVWLDVKSGTVAKVGVFSKVCVDVTATVDVTLSYTYEGKTYTVHRSNTDTDTACKTVRDFAKKRITKHTSRHASAQAVARAKARVETQATAQARTAAIAKAKAKATRTVSVVIRIDRNNPPSLSATANACVDYGQSYGVVSGVLTNPNNEAHPFTVSSPGKQPYSGTVGANTNATFQLYGFAPGTYDVTATLTDINLSTTVRVTVNPCPPPAENKPPTGEIVQAPEHLYPGGEYRVKVVGSDSEDGGNVTLSVSVTGAASIITDANHPVHEDIEGGSRVRYFWIKAGNTTGNATITLVVTDRSNKTFYASKTFPVVADQF